MGEGDRIAVDRAVSWYRDDDNREESGPTAKKDSQDIGVFVSVGVSPADISREPSASRDNILRARQTHFVFPWFSCLHSCEPRSFDSSRSVSRTTGTGARFEKSGRQAPKGKIKRVAILENNATRPVSRTSLSLSLSLNCSATILSTQRAPLPPGIT